MLFSRLHNYFAKSTVLGVDLSQDSIKLLALQSIGNNFLVKKFLVDHQGMKDEEQLMVNLMHLVNQEKLVGYSVALSVPDEWIIRKKIQLPVYLPVTSLYEEISVRLIEYFPGVNNCDLHFDFIVESNNDEVYEICLYLIYYSQIKNIISILESANLVVRIVDSDIYASSRCLIWYLKLRGLDSLVIMMLDFRGDKVNLMLFLQNQCIFYQSWMLDSDFADRVRQAWLAAQLRFTKLSVHAIGLSGDFAKLSDISGVLESEFSVLVEIITPIQAMSVDKNVAQALLDQHASQLLVCSGLAMRRVPC